MYELLSVKLARTMISSCNMAVVVAVADDHWLHQLDQTHIQSKISEQAMTRVASGVSGIVSVGNIMGFTSAQIRQYQDQCPHSVLQQFTLMFFDWRKYDSSATVEKFVTLMRDAGVDDHVVREVITTEYSDDVNNGVLQLH